MQKAKVVVAAAVAACMLGAAVGAAQVPRDPKAAASPQATWDGVIAGTVVSADAGRPIRRARVTILGGSPKVSHTALSDEQGAFRFSGLPPGQYLLNSSKGGYLETIYGQKHPGSGRPGTPIQLGANQELNRIALPLARGGVITGTVTDETGEPVFGTQVRAYRWVRQSGERMLQSAGSDATDDRGVYRIPRLLPGEYVVSAMPRAGEGYFTIDLEEGALYKKVIGAIADGSFSVAISEKGGVMELSGSVSHDESRTGFATLFYPGTMQVSAAASIPVTPGEERTGVDFQLQVVPLGRVSGSVMGPDGPAARAEVMLIDPTAPSGFGAQTTGTDREGRFSFSGIAPGQYMLVARATPKGGKPLEAGGREAAEFLASIGNEANKAGASPADIEKKRAAVAAAMAQAAQLWAMAATSTDGREFAGAQLVLQPGMTVSGQVVLEGGAGAPPNLTRMSLNVAPVGLQAFGDMAMPPPAPVDANGRFTIRGIMPGRYRIAAAGGVPSGYTLRSAVFGGQDVLDIPFELTGTEHLSGGLVTFTTQTTEVTGSVQDASSQPVAGVTVIAFSAEERFWTPQSPRIRAVRPASDGRYVLKNLPPGDYRLVALADVEPGQWFDPEFLRTLAGFATVTISEGGKVTQDFRVR